MKTPRDANGQRNALGDRIRLARRGAKLSQAALARAVGVTASAAAQWEHPQGTRPGLGHVAEIARVTQVAMEWLVSGRGGMRAAAAEAPAVDYRSYAQDLAEEQLLGLYCGLSARKRELVIQLLTALQ
jgi:transcriptional regulator with XRE-family HTH domain